MRVWLAVLFVLAMIGQSHEAQAEGYCTAPKFPREQSRVVVDDGNNLRKWGGKDYASAPVLKVLNSGNEVKLVRLDGKWAEVETDDGMRGFVNAKCLAPYEEFVAGKSPAGYFEQLLGCGETEKVVSLKADLDGDGRMETIRLSCESGMGCNNHFMDVLSPEGTILFKGPRHGESPLIFCGCEVGRYEIGALGDLDGDKRGELLTVKGPSDVSPAGFLLFRWNGAGFDKVWGPVRLVSEKGTPDVFRKESDGSKSATDPFRFLVGVQSDSKGQMIAHVAGADSGYGEAVVILRQGEVVVSKWLKAYKK